jgi:hypothetical protein
MSRRTGIGDALSILAARVCQLEAERDALAAELATLREHQFEVARRLYRRGYGTGHAVGRRGAAPESAPERHARGWARKELAA